MEDLQLPSRPCKPIDLWESRWDPRQSLEVRGSPWTSFQVGGWMPWMLTHGRPEDLRRHPGTCMDLRGLHEVFQGNSWDLLGSPRGSKTPAHTQGPPQTLGRMHPTLDAGSGVTSGSARGGPKLSQCRDLPYEPGTMPRNQCTSVQCPAPCEGGRTQDAAQVAQTEPRRSSAATPNRGRRSTRSPHVAHVIAVVRAGAGAWTCWHSSRRECGKCKREAV